MNQLESTTSGWSCDMENTRQVAVFLFCIAILVRLVYWLGFNANPYSHIVEPTHDSMNVFESAVLLRNGDWLMNRPDVRYPLYSYFVGTIFTLAGTGLQSVWFVQFLLGAICTVLVYRVALHHFSHGEALIAGILYAVYPQNLFYESSLLRDVPAGFLVVGAAYALTRLKKKRSLLNLIASGVTISLVIQARANLIVVLPFLLVYLWFSVLKDIPSRSRLAGIAAFLATAILLAVPLLWRGMRVEKRFILFDPSGPSVLLMGNLSDYDGVGWHMGSPRYQEYVRNDPDAVWRSYPKALGLIAGEVRSDPGAFLALYLRKAYYFFTNTEIADNNNFYLYQRFSPVLRNPVGSFTILSLLGLTGAGISLCRNRRPWLLHVFLAGTIASVLLFYNVSRFRLPVYPFLMMFAAIALVWITGIVRKRLVLAPVILLVFSLAVWLLNFRPLVKIRANDWAMLGHAHSSLRQQTEAINCYERALEIVPKYRDARYLLGCSYCVIGDYGAGIQQFLELLNGIPKDDSINVKLAMAYLWWNKPEEARRYASVARLAGLDLPVELNRILDGVPEGGQIEGIAPTEGTGQ